MQPTVQSVGSSENLEPRSLRSKEFLFGLLPHEVFFGIFLLVMWGRLVLTEGFLSVDALLYFGLIAGAVAAVWGSHGDRKPWMLRTSLLYFPVAMEIIFPHMKTAVPKIHPSMMDPWLQKVDGVLIGTNLSLRLQPLVHPLL